MWELTELYDFEMSNCDHQGGESPFLSHHNQQLTALEIG
jgi:hypothetical protein